MADLMFSDSIFFHGWLQTSGPNTEMLYGGGCIRLTGNPTRPRGDVTLLRCQDPVNPGQTVVVGQRTGTPGNNTAQLRMPLDTDKMLMAAICEFTAQFRYTECDSPNDPASWSYIISLVNCRITQDEIDGLDTGDYDGKAGNPVDVIADIVFEEMHLVRYPEMALVTVTAVVGADLLDIAMCDVPSCPGACGIGGPGCETGHAISADGNVEQLHTTTDGGGSWTPQDSPFTEIYDQLIAVDCVGDLVIVVNGTANGLIARSADGGATWVVIDTEINAPLNDVFMLDAANVWVCGDGGHIAYSGNGGLTWEIQEDGTVAGAIALNEIHFYDTELGLCVGAGGAILQTLDGGNVWAAMTSGTVNALNTVAHVSKWVWFVGGVAGTLRYSMDRGVTWAARAGVFAATDIVNGIIFCSQFGFAVGETDTGHGVFHLTPDGGYNWQLVRTETDTPYNAVECCDPEKIFIAADDGTLVMSVT